MKLDGHARSFDSAERDSGQVGRAHIDRWGLGDLAKTFQLVVK